MTTVSRDHFPTRVALEFKKKKGQIALDQLRVIDRERVIMILGKADASVQQKILFILRAMFS